MAVGQGFEPREPLGSTVFKTAAFDHSASPPKLFAGKAPGGERALYRRALSDQVSPLPIRLRGALWVIARTRHILLHDRHWRCFRDSKEFTQLGTDCGFRDRLRRNPRIVHGTACFGHAGCRVNILLGCFLCHRILRLDSATGSSAAAGSAGAGSACSCTDVSSASAAGGASAAVSFIASTSKASGVSASGSAKAALRASEEATSTAGAACSAWRRNCFGVGCFSRAVRCLSYTSDSTL